MGSLMDPNDQSGLFSRLPSDRDYWDTLTNEIMNSVSPTIRAYKFSRHPWWAPIARMSRPLAAGALVATILTALVLTPNSEGPMNSSTLDAFGLAPVDPLATTMVTRETPPAGEMLWVVRAKEDYQ